MHKKLLKPSIVNLHQPHTDKLNLLTSEVILLDYSTKIAAFKSGLRNILLSTQLSRRARARWACVSSSPTNTGPARSRASGQSTQASGGRLDWSTNNYNYILSQVMVRVPTKIKSSDEFISRRKHRVIRADRILVSSDISALYTNIPLEHSRKMIIK